MGTYTLVALCIVGMSLFFNAGKFEARSGGPDHAMLWAALSLVTSLLAFWAGAGGILWILSQLALFALIAMARVVLEDRDR